MGTKGNDVVLGVKQGQLDLLAPCRPCGNVLASRFDLEALYLCTSSPDLRKDFLTLSPRYGDPPPSPSEHYNQQLPASYRQQGFNCPKRSRYDTDQRP